MSDAAANIFESACNRVKDIINNMMQLQLDSKIRFCIGFWLECRSAPAMPCKCDTDYCEMHFEAIKMN